MRPQCQTKREEEMSYDALCYPEHLRLGDRVLIEDYVDVDGEPVMAAAVVADAPAVCPDNRHVFVTLKFSPTSTYSGEFRRDILVQLLPEERWAEVVEARRAVLRRLRLRRVAA